MRASLVVTMISVDIKDSLINNGAVLATICLSTIEGLINVIVLLIVLEAGLNYKTIIRFKAITSMRVLAGKHSSIIGDVVVIEESWGQVQARVLVHDAI